MYDRIIASVTATPWAIEPSRGQAVFDALSRRVDAGVSDPEAIRLAREIAADRKKKQPASKSRSVGYVPVFGILTQRADWFAEVSGLASYESVGQQIDAYLADPEIEAIVLHVDSPGGSVYGVEQAAIKINAAAKKKRVIAVVDSLAASGAYWLAAQASEIVVVPDGEVGSIGVFHPHVDQSRAIDASGRKITLVSAGRLKTATNGYEPLSSDGRAVIQKGVDDFYDLFIRAVARGRNVSQSTVRSDFGEGATVRARVAVSRGMADRIGTLDEVLDGYGVSLTGSRPAQLAAATGPSRMSSDPEIAKRKALLEMDEISSRKALLAADRRHPTIAPVTPVTTAAIQHGPVTEELRRIAAHEAGHAIVATEVGARVSLLSIIPEPGYLGVCRHAKIRDGVSDAAICHAGAIAEKLMGFSHIELGGTDASDLAGDQVGRSTDGREKARKILGSNLLALRRLQAALLERRWLDGDQVRQIIRGW
jgi:signal peptide peptidase SppA